ncbi:hypothetical protein EVAR_46861_1 [Eumeta japonica]|uniref:Uncharacterized protein n=1 Tax=Eumeta variegata TaxID=151549 RepID=A0A4C1XSA3_EUMVA|nr:hypothetical protein EVAR_46861_1 [Eumeta japonica]
MRPLVDVRVTRSYRFRGSPKKLMELRGRACSGSSTIPTNQAPQNCPDRNAYEEELAVLHLSKDRDCLHTHRRQRVFLQGEDDGRRPASTRRRPPRTYR